MAKKDEHPHELVNITPTEIAPSDLAAMMAIEAERRQLVTQFIAQHMKKDVDYGTISIGGRASKPSLFKPGSEKFLSLFKLTATFRQDAETWAMAGSTNGLFTYVCEIKTAKGGIVGEGRGAANLQEKSNWTVNNAIKIAQKRAQIDAVLRMGALSDFFTQDLEDMVSSQPAMRTVKRVTPPEDAPVSVVEAVKPKPAAKSKLDTQRQQVKDLLDTNSMDLLVSKEDYETACERLTGLKLEPNFYQDIIERLESYGKA